jgi:hypothetical protein
MKRKVDSKTDRRTGAVDKQVSYVKELGLKGIGVDQELVSDRSGGFYLGMDNLRYQFGEGFLGMNVRRITLFGKDGQEIQEQIKKYEEAGVPFKIELGGKLEIKISRDEK